MDKKYSKLPRFNGKLSLLEDIASLPEFIKKIESAKKAEKWTEKETVDIASKLFTGEAKVWWESLQKSGKTSNFVWSRIESCSENDGIEESLKQVLMERFGESLRKSNALKRGFKMLKRVTFSDKVQYFHLKDETKNQKKKKKKSGPKKALENSKYFSFNWQDYYDEIYHRV